MDISFHYFVVKTLALEVGFNRDDAGSCEAQLNNMRSKDWR